MGTAQVPTAAKVRELKRELALRRSYYPKAIANGNLSKKEADYRIEVIESILNDYERRASSEVQKPRLPLPEGG